MNQAHKQLGQMMLNEPDCKSCRGTGLTSDELEVCEACYGYGRGGGLVRKKIRQAIQTVQQRDQEQTRPFKISDYTRTVCIRCQDLIPEDMKNLKIGVARNDERK